MSHMLVDDPQALFVGGEDKGVSKLAQGLEGRESGECIGLLCRRWFVTGFSVRGIVTDRDTVSGKGKTTRRGWNDRSGKFDGGGFYGLSGVWNIPLGGFRAIRKIK